jgi:copper(I)-binding protein
MNSYCGELIMKPGFALLALCLHASPLLAAAPVAGTRSESAAPGQAQQLPLVEGAWVRPAVAGQQGTGAFMKLTARQATQLVGASSPVAGTAEVHEMKMEGDIMRMRRIARLDLPAGQAVELKPGGYHLMLMDLKQPVAAGSTVPLTLLFRDASGAESRLELKVPVATKAPGSGGHVPAGSHKQ